MYNNFSSKKTKKVISALLASALVVTSAPITADAATSKVLGVKKTFTVAGTKVTGLSKAEKKVVKVTIKNKKVTVKGLKAGKVTFKIGKKAYTVKVGATKVALTPAATSLKVNEKTKVAIVASNGKNDKLTVKTSNNSIVKISKSSVTANASGKASITLKGLAAGTSKITVTSKNTGKTASVKINVVADEVVTQAPVVSDSPVVSGDPSTSQAPVVSGDPSTSQAPATSNDPNASQAPSVTTGTITATPEATTGGAVTKSAVVAAATAVNGTETVTLPATNINAASKINLTFSDDIDATSIISGNITLTKDGVKQLIAVTYNSAKKAAIVGMKTSVFEAGATYVVTVNGVKNVDGTAIPTYTTTFTVAQNAIIEDAKYDKSATADADLNGDVVNSSTENITLKFNKEMDITSAKNTANYKIYDVTAKKFIDKTGLSASTTSGKTTVTFTTGTLETGHEYQLTVEGVVALDGTAMLPATYKFFYGISPLTFVPRSTFAGAEAVAVGDKASRPVYGSLTAFKGYSPFSFKGQLSADADPATVNAETVVLTEKATGNVVATNVSYETGSRYVILTPVADLKQDTTYVITVDGIKTEKGLTIGQSTFTFTVGDYEAPTVVSVTPGDGEDKVAVNKNIVITFSEKMESLSTLITKIGLKDLTTNTDINIPEYYATSLSQDGKTLTMTNTKDLEVGTTYQITIKGDGYTSASASDAVGNQLVADYVIKFATVDATTTYVKAVTKNTTGTYDSTDKAIDSGLTKVGTTDNFYFTFDKALTASGSQPASFKVSVDKKAPTDTTWTPLTIATNFTTGFESGNKTINVKPKSTWAADNLYRITISGAKDINGNDVAEQVFTFTTGNAPSLVNTLPAEYATKVALKNAYVYVTLTDADGSDIDVSTLNAQTVKFVKKADQSIAPYTLVSAQYKAEETLDTIATIHAGTTFTATDSDSAKKFAKGQLILVGSEYAVVNDVTATTVTVDRTLSAGSSVDVKSVQGVVYKLNDDAQLDGNSQYQFVISGVKDVAGNEMDATSKTFTTDADTQTLKFVSSTVENGAAGVAVDKELKLTFNEAIDIDASKALDSNLTSLDKIVTVADTNGDVTAKFNITQDKGVVTLAPKGFLKANEVYTLTVDQKASSANSGALATIDKTIRFQTEANASVSPKIVSAKFVEGASSTKGTVVLTLNAPVGYSVAEKNVFVDGSASGTISGIEVKNDGYTVAITYDALPSGFSAEASKIALKAGLADSKNAFSALGAATTQITLSGTDAPTLKVGQTVTVNGVTTIITNITDEDNDKITLKDSVPNGSDTNFTVSVEDAFNNAFSTDAVLVTK